MSLASGLIKLNLKHSSPKMSSPITEYQQERSPVWETRIRSFHQSESCATLFPSMPLESFSFLTSFSLQDRYSRKNVYLFNNSENRTSEEFMLAQYMKSWFCFLPLLSDSSLGPMLLFLFFLNLALKICSQDAEQTIHWESHAYDYLTIKTIIITINP